MVHPSPLWGRGCNARVASCRWHSWAKDLGAVDTKQPWARAKDVPEWAGAKGGRWLRVWSPGMNPKGSCQEWKVRPTSQR